MDKEAGQIRPSASLLVQVRPLNILTASRCFRNTMLLTTSQGTSRVSILIPVLPSKFSSAGGEANVSTLVTGYRAKRPGPFPEDLLVIEVKARGTRVNKKGIDRHFHLLPCPLRTYEPFPLCTSARKLAACQPLGSPRREGGCLSWKSRVRKRPKRVLQAVCRYPAPRFRRSPVRSAFPLALPRWIGRAFASLCY